MEPDKSSSDSLKDKTSPAVIEAQPRLEAITALDRAIIQVGRALSLLFFASCLIIMIEIVARYVFNSPTFWVHETTTLLCALLFAYGGIHCMANNKHIRIGLIYDTVSAKMRRYLDILISFLLMIYALILAYAAGLVAYESLYTPWGAFRMETSGSAWDPPFPAIIKSFLFLVLAVMVIQTALHLVYHIRRKVDA
nr:TRAP transporter small permease [uncultured Cohaesibacter sp.]